MFHCSLLFLIITMIFSFIVHSFIPRQLLACHVGSGTTTMVMGAKILKFKFVNEKLSFGLFEFGPTQTLCLCGPSGPYVERCRPGLIYKTTSLFFYKKKKKNTKRDYLGVNIQFLISIVIK